MYDYYRNWEDQHDEEVRKMLDLTAPDVDLLLAQLGALWAKLDERGKNTIMALAISQAKLCAK